MYQQKNNQVIFSTTLVKSARLQSSGEQFFPTGASHSLLLPEPWRDWSKACGWSLSVSHPLTDGRFHVFIQHYDEIHLNVWPLKQHVSKSTELESTWLNNQQQEWHVFTLVPKPWLLTHSTHSFSFALYQSPCSHTAATQPCTSCTILVYLPAKGRLSGDLSHQCDFWKIHSMPKFREGASAFRCKDF